MTHEVFANADERGGPECDHSLPDATDIPGDLSATDSDADPLED